MFPAILDMNYVLHESPSRFAKSLPNNFNKTHLNKSICGIGSLKRHFTSNKSFKTQEQPKRIEIWVHTFSTYAKFPKNLTFLRPVSRGKKC